MSLSKALAFSLKWEGGYVNDPDDPGGATMQGVTQKTYDAYRTSLGEPVKPVKEISAEEVAALYLRDYWEKAACPDLPEPLDMIQFDAAVNHGVGQALKFLWAARQANVGHPENVYLKLRDQFYADLVKRKPNMAKFLAGWLKRTADLRKVAGVS